MLKNLKRQLAGVVATLGLMGLMSGAVQAFPTLPGLVLPNYPDLLVTSITATFDPGSTGDYNFVLTGIPFGIDDDGDNTTALLDIFDAPNTGGFGTFRVETKIDTATGQALGGSLTVVGTLPALGYTSGNLLEADLAAFAVNTSGGGSILEFLFDNPTGDLAGMFSPEVGMVISLSGQSVNFGGSGFTLNNLNADVAPVPVPAPLALMTLGLVTIGWQMRRRG